MKGPKVIGLTGNRLSGKETASSVFKSIGVPVFDADLVLKYFIFNRYDLSDSVNTLMGPAYTTSGRVDLSKFKTDASFSKMLDIMDFDINEAFNKFKSKNSDSIYVIFKCSWIFEKKIESRFDKIISIFAPKDKRILRHKVQENVTYIQSNTIFKNELTDSYKNSRSHFSFHNYDGGPELDIQIRDFDNKMIDEYFEHFLTCSNE